MRVYTTAFHFQYNVEKLINDTNNLISFKLILKLVFIFVEKTMFNKYTKNKCTKNIYNIVIS